MIDIKGVIIKIMNVECYIKNIKIGSTEIYNLSEGRIHGGVCWFKTKMNKWEPLELNDFWNSLWYIFCLRKLSEEDSDEVEDDDDVDHEPGYYEEQEEIRKR